MFTDSHAHRASIQRSATAAPAPIAAACAPRGSSLRVQMLASLVLIALLAQPSAWGRTEIPEAMQPQLFSARDGRVWLAYAKGKDLFVAYSKDGGVDFSAPVKVVSDEKFMIGMRRGPRVVAEGEQVTVTVIGSELLSYHSSDGGLTWSLAHTINEVPGSAREGLHDLTAAPGGRVFVTWLDLRNGKMELWGARSSDAGRTWARNEQVYRSPDKSVCECCHPTAHYNEAGKLAVMWRNSIAGNRDLWLATEATGAGGFSAQKLGMGSWALNACPMDGGDILALGGGAFTTVWQRAGEVYYCAPGGMEIGLGKGKQPVGVHVGGRSLVFWQDGNQLMMTRDANKSAPAKHAENARYPSVVATGDHAVLAYEQGKAGETRIVIERL